MPVYPALGAALTRLTVAILQSNDIIPSVVKKYEEEEDDGIYPKPFWYKPKIKIDGYFYPQLLHGPDKHYRPILTGHMAFMTKSSAETAAELLLRYARQLEPLPEQWYPDEEQLMLFTPGELPELQAA